MKKEDENLILKEIKGCFDYFYNEINKDESSIGFGLTLDEANKKTISIAACGFSLTSYMIGVERGYISFDEAKYRVKRILENVYLNVPHDHGFLAHFLDMYTLNMKPHTEYSTIDTAIFLMGAITVSEYFDDEIKELAYKILDRVDWNYIIKTRNGKTQFLMAMFPENPAYDVYWDHYAEQLMMYILYAGSKNADSKTARSLYYDFERNVGSYKGENLIYCFGNPLFIHQYTHSFFDFSKYLDERGCDWFRNSVNATLANREYCIDHNEYKTYKDDCWGLSATKTNHGYRVYGAKPFGFNNDYDENIDGTVAVCAPLSSICFTPKESIEALRYFSTIKEINKEYGLTESFNLDEGWYSDSYLGIDKGATMIMLDNYLFGTTYKNFMKSPIVDKAIKILNLIKK